MDKQTSVDILNKVQAEREKRAEPTAEALAAAAHKGNNDQVHANAVGDLNRMALASLGIGAAGAGAVGLYNMLKRNIKPHATASGPATLPMPYPVAVPDEEKTAGVVDYIKDLFKGKKATSESGIPWQGAAMLGTGMAGVGLGWKGTNMLLDKQHERESEEEMNKARQEFHDALMAQYQTPRQAHPSLIRNKAAADNVMVKVGEELDRLWANMSTHMTKRAEFDLGQTAGHALNGYGVYAGLSSLLTGAMVYDKMQKRSQRAILDKALQRRQRRQFAQAPTEIYAVPEPVAQS